ncbi:MAG TPA: hypothetical protein V6D07_12665 [Trichocoleus sp.]
MIAEPITALTDYAIALQSALFTSLLLRFKRIERLWAAAFACVSLAALLGGTYHGFSRSLTPDDQYLLWQVLAYAMGGSSFFMVVATAQAILGRKLQWVMLLLATGKLLAYLYATHIQLNFAYIVADYLLAMLVLLSLELRWGLRPQRPGAVWIIAGVGVSAIAVVALAFPWSGIAMFTPVDVYHLVQMVALSCFYLGVWLNV